MRRLSIFVIALILLSIVASAGPPITAKPQSPRFIEDVRLRKLSDGNLFHRAVVKIGANDTASSGAFTSDEGHLITAAHALEHCVVRGKSGPPVHACEIEINGVQRRVEILAGNFKCTREERDDLARDSKKPDPRGCRKGSQADAALIRVLDVDRSYTRCLRVSSREVIAGDPVITLGFPTTTDRWDSRPEDNSDGQSLRYTDSGLVIPFGAPAHYERKQKDGSIIKSDPLTLPVASDNYAKEYFQANLDTVPGNSGGPSFDLETGEMVGIASFFVHAKGVDVKKTEFRNSGVYQRVNRLREVFRELNPNLADYDRAFRCQNPLLMRVPRDQIPQRPMMLEPGPAAAEAAAKHLRAPGADFEARPSVGRPARR